MTPVPADELLIHLEQDLAGQPYALASTKAAPEVPLLFRREPEGYVPATSQEEADAFAELVFLQSSIAQTAGPLLEVELPDGETVELHHTVSVTLAGQEYLVLSEGPLSPQILCTRGPEGTLELVQDPAVAAAVQAHWDQVRAQMPQPQPDLEPDPSPEDDSPAAPASEGGAEDPAQLLAEARARASELRLTLQVFPPSRRGSAEHAELSGLADQLDAQIALLEAHLGGG